MVSPSKLQQHRQQPPQQQQQHIRAQQQGQRKNGDTTRSTTNPPARTGAPAAAARSLRILQKGPKPLKNKTFYLDIKNHAYSSKLEARLKELGGEIELFLVKSVTLVVSDKSDKSGPGTTSDRCKWGYASGGSGGPPSLRSIEVQTPTPTPPTPYRSVEGPLSNSTNQRGQTTQRSKSRVDAMLERALTQPQQCSVDPLHNALSWGIPIWSPYQLQSWLDKITASLKDSIILKRDNRTGLGKDLKVKHLKEPYIKFESYRRESRPVFLELQSWPTLNFDGDPGSCPFDLKRRDKKEAASNKEIKENREKYFNPNISKGKDMTRRPRATATRARKTENTGYCEICRIDYRNLSKHLQSDQHLNFVRNDKNFLSLDNLISTGASVEAFLEINRSKDVGKDCNLFSSRDHSLDNGILSLDEKEEKRDKSDLNDFSIDEMKIIQCNGARRNLSLKLDAPHNLRTRAKHESGHLLRSKGRPWHDEEKGEKLYDKYTIKKRAKGTIWIEEDDSEDDKDLENSQHGCDGKTLFHRICEPELNKIANRDIKSENVSVNGDIDINIVDFKIKENSVNKVSTRENSFRDSLLEENLKTKINGYERKEEKHKLNEILHDPEIHELKQVNQLESNEDALNRNILENNKNSERLPPNNNEDTNSLKMISKDDQAKYKLARRGGRSYRGRQRLSVEERLIEDNRDYYKVEVLGNKLRSSAIPSSNVLISPLKEQLDRTKKDEKSSSEKPVVVRFKRVRKSELSLLSDEAESFMFGDSRREDDSSESSDGEQSSVLPKDTESDRDENVNASLPLISSPIVNISPKQEVIEDDLQDSSINGRARKKRRTQTEALIKDNTDYYKFETPGSRLRYQAPLTGICDPVPEKDPVQPQDSTTTEIVEKIYPSKPSPEIEKMHFSFEAVPRSEPWYQTYQRQDEGAEFWHYFSESDAKPFLLPYEIENFHEILHKSLQSVHRKRGRGRGSHANVGSRSPRKSPRCHASTLAIMSTIIRRREQQQTTTTTATTTTTTTTTTATTTHSSNVEQEAKVKPSHETAKPEKKYSEKSDVDEDLKEIVKNLDDMLSSNDMHDMESYEVDLIKNVDDAVLESDVTPKGAPVNLLELLDNCNEIIPPNGIENSSCASSECGEFYSEFPLKRRKKRKNKTGWPGNKMRRKLHIKHLSEELQRELELERSLEFNDGKLINLNLFEDTSSNVSHEDEVIEIERDTGKENERVLNLSERKSNRGRRTKVREVVECRDRSQESSETRSSEDVQSKIVLKSVFGDEVSPRKNRSDNSDKCKVENDEVETHIIKDSRHLDSKGTLSSISEDSEASLSNNENLCTKDSNSLLPHEKHLPLKYTRKRQRKNTTSSETSHHLETENRRHSSVSSPSKRLPKSNSKYKDNPVNIITSKDRKRPKKYERRNDRSPTKVIFDNRNSKKQSFLSLKERRRIKRVRRDDSVSSELRNGELDCALSERVSPSLVSSSEMDQRRSSIDFQPVVRVMKIEDQVDMDNSILSVAVASNRRLRSSSSPRSNMQPPNKRYRNTSGKRNFSGQWIKNS